MEGRKERKRRGRGEGKAGGELILPRVNGPISALLRTGRSLLPFDSLFRGGRVCGDQITKKLEKYQGTPSATGSGVWANGADIQCPLASYNEKRGDSNRKRLETTPSGQVKFLAF